MKRKIILFILVLLCASKCCKAQELTGMDSLYRKAAVCVLDKYLAEEKEDKNIIVYSIGTDWHLVIIENPGDYAQYVIYSGLDGINGIAETKTINKPDTLFAGIFDPSNYPEGFTNLRSEFYKDGYKSALTHNSSYFVLIDPDGNKYGEAVIPIVVNPSPIPYEIYLYLYSTVISVINRGV